MPISDIETSFGTSAEGASEARVPGIPSLVDNGALSITIDFDENGNAPEVVYAIYVEEDSVDKGYLAADGTDNGATEVWQTYEDWGTITASGLTDFTAYRFKVKGKSELAVETAFSDYSAVMNSLPDIDYGQVSDPLSREVSGGNTKVLSTLVDSIQTSVTVTGTLAIETVANSFYGDITLGYTLINDDSTASRVVIEFSEDNVNWAAATESTDPDSEGLTGLNTSPAGVEHKFIWDSYTDAGTSENDSSVYLRITPYDASPTGGDAGAAVSSPAFGVNNLPAVITFANSDGKTFDKDTTPVFIAILSSLRGGTICFPKLTIYASDGTTIIQTCDSVKNIAGWEYETAHPDPAEHWTPLTSSGIPVAVIDGINRVRYTVQSALPAAEYIIIGQNGELRNLG